MTPTFEYLTCLDDKPMEHTFTLAQIESDDFAVHNRFLALTMLTLDDLNMYAEPFALIHKLLIKGTHARVSNAEILCTVKGSLKMIEEIDAEIELREDERTGIRRQASA